MWSAGVLQVRPNPPENAFSRCEGKMAITFFLTRLETCGFHHSVQISELYNMRQVSSLTLKFDVNGGRFYMDRAYPSMTKTTLCSSNIRKNERSHFQLEMNYQPFCRVLKELSFDI